MYVLDTNVASELMLPSPSAVVATWIAAHNAQDMFLTAVTEAELRYGIAILESGRKKKALEVAMTRWLNVGFDRRILPFDTAAAKHYAEIASLRRGAGRPISEADCQIAAVTQSHSAILVTRNVRDFEETGTKFVDPWTTN